MPTDFCQLLNLLFLLTKIAGFVILAFVIFEFLRVGWLLLTAGGANEMFLLARKTFLWAIVWLILAGILTSATSIVASNAWGSDLLTRCGIEQ